MSVVNRRLFLLGSVSAVVAATFLSSQSVAAGADDEIVMVYDKTIKAWVQRTTTAQGGPLSGAQATAAAASRSRIWGILRGLANSPWARGLMMAGTLFHMAETLGLMGQVNTASPPSTLAMGEVAPGTAPTIQDLVAKMDQNGGAILYEGYGYAAARGGSATQFPHLDPASGWSEYWVDTSNSLGRAQFVNGSLDKWFFVAKTNVQVANSNTALLQALKNLFKAGAHPLAAVTDTQIATEVAKGVTPDDLKRYIVETLQETLPDITTADVVLPDTRPDWGPKLAEPIPEGLPEEMPDTGSGGSSSSGGGSSSSSSGSGSSSSTSLDWTPPPGTEIPSVADLPWPDPFNIGSPPAVLATCTPPQVPINMAIPFSDETIGTITVGGWCDIITSVGPWLRSFLLAVCGIGFVTSTILDD